MSAILPFNLAPAAPPDLATAYWRSLCCAAGYLNDNAATLISLATLAGASSVQTITFSSPLPNRAYCLTFPAGVSVVINGTTEPGQFIVQATGAILQTNPFGTGHVNSYDALAAIGINAALRPVLMMIAPAQVIYTGHSLGGAVAQLLAQQAATWAVVGAWTAGQPRVGASDWALAYSSSSERYTTAGDPVPAVPPAANALVDLTLQPIWPFAPQSYRHAGRRRHVLPDGTITSPAETPSWTEGMEYLVDVQLGNTGWYGAHEPATYALRIRQAIPVPWMGSSPDWPLIGALDALAAPLIGLPAGVPSGELFTTLLALFGLTVPANGVGRFATQGVCQ